MKILKEESDEKGSQSITGKVLQETDPEMRDRAQDVY